MKITVLGLWHLGCVTAACCARHFRVTGLDFDEAIIRGLQEGRAPLLEPGLNELISAGLRTNSLRFLTEPGLACAEADVLWVCYDTPVNDDDVSDVGFVLERVRRALRYMREGTAVLISSQLPVGTCGQLEREFPDLCFAYSPENLRLGKAIEAFEKADRAVVGIRDDSKRALLEQLFRPFAANVLFMKTESAEMVKHALNSFLALSITFINEVARLCEQVGADAKEVSIGLKSEPRIGPKAYLGAGGAFAGGTLARDVVTLTKLGEQYGQHLRLIPAIKESNNEHRSWALRKLKARLGDLSGKCVAVLGLVYTPNTNTLRRSSAVELCRALANEGVSVQAYDPAITELPSELSVIRLSRNLKQALAGADAAVVCTEWPEFKQASWNDLIPELRSAIIVDANRFLEKPLQDVRGVEHISVGRR